MNLITSGWNSDKKYLADVVQFTAIATYNIDFITIVIRFFHEN